jgi:hypothetical protein
MATSDLMQHCQLFCRTLFIQMHVTFFGLKVEFLEVKCNPSGCVTCNV